MLKLTDSLYDAVINEYDVFKNQGFSQKLKHKEVMKAIQPSADSITNYRKPNHYKNKLSPNIEKSYREPYSPIKKDDLPLDKYLILKAKEKIKNNETDENK